MTLLLTADLVLPAGSRPALAQNGPQPAQPEPLTTTLTIETIANLGVATGSGALPRHVALDRTANQLYLLDEGSLARQEGNGLSIYDVEAGAFVDQIEINQGDNAPLDLQVDPQNNLIYALWQARYGSSRPVLSVIDSGLLQIVQEVPDVDAFVSGDGLLYLADAEQLRAVNLANNSLAQAEQVDLTPAAATGPLALDAASDRLYLARSLDGSRWRVEIFEASTLTPLSSFSADSLILDILPVAGTDELLLIVADSGFRQLYRLNSSGELLDLPYELGPYTGAAGSALAPDGDTFFFSSGQSSSGDSGEPDQAAPGAVLIGLNRQTLAETHNIPLLTAVDDLAIDNGLAYGVYPFEHTLYIVDLESEQVEIEKSLIQVRDVLVDAEAGLLYVSDSANRIRKLAQESLNVLAEVTLQNNGPDFGFRAADWSGELALDRAQQRLYVSGLPATVLDAGSLAEIQTLTPGGQIAVDAGRERLYLSNCGVSVLAADTLREITVLPGSTRRPDDLVPNPCVATSRLDVDNQWLYGLAPNGVPGSNGGNQLLVYSLAATPTLVLSDTNISVTAVEPNPAAQRAFVSHVRNSNRRVRTLDPAQGRYTRQLLGLWGSLRYSPASQRLYVGDRNHSRLLAIDAEGLGVVDSLWLPPADDYRLVALDPTSERLYLAGVSGQLLVAAPGPETAASVEFQPLNPFREASGVISRLDSPAEGDIFARIEAHFDQFSSEQRLYHSNNTGLDWDDLSQFLPAMPLQTFATSPAYAQDQTLFAGLLSPGQAGGLYKSVDGGAQWQPAMHGLQDIWTERLFIAPDFARSGFIFAGTTYGGLHLSTDGGRRWEPLALLDPNGSFPTASAEYAAAFGGDGTILASQALPGQMYGLFRATRTANSTVSAWEQVLDRPVQQLALSPDGQTALAFGTALWRSTDGGQRWEIGGQGLGGIDDLQPARFIFSPTFAQDQTVYFFFSDRGGSPPGILFRSTDGGQSWQPWRTPDSTKSFTAISMTPSGDFLLGDTNARLIRLAPDEISWAASTLPTEPFAIDALAAPPNDESGQIAFAVDAQAGLFLTTNGGRRWQQSSYPARSFSYSLKPAQIAVSPAYVDDQTLYVASGLSLHRSTDGGESWQALSTGEPGRSFQAQQVALSPDFGRDRTLLAGTPAAIYRSADGGDDWQPVLRAEIDSLQTDVLALAPNGQTAYARFGYGSPLYRSDDGGQSWQAQTLGEDEFFTILDAATDAAGNLYAIVEYERKLLRIGPGDPAWTDISDALPADLTGLTAIVSQGGVEQLLLLAGPDGVFSSPDTGQSWQPVSELGLPDDAELSRLAAAETDLWLATTAGGIYTTAGNGLEWINSSIVK